MTGSPIFFRNLTKRKNISNPNYDMSIKNCQATKKCFIVLKSNAWCKLARESGWECEAMSLRDVMAISGQA